MSILVPTMYGRPFVEIYGGHSDVYAAKRGAWRKRDEMITSRPKSNDDNIRIPEGMEMTMTLGTPTVDIVE